MSFVENVMKIQEAECVGNFWGDQRFGQWLKAKFQFDVWFGPCLVIFLP